MHDVGYEELEAAERNVRGKAVYNLRPETNGNMTNNEYRDFQRGLDMDQWEYRGRMGKRIRGRGEWLPMRFTEGRGEAE